MQHSLAILDDYQSVALKIADWSAISDTAKVPITVFSDHLSDETEVIARLKPFTIICIMRERTKFTPALFAGLPNLKLLVTTGMRNLGIDLEAARAHGVVVSGTGSGGESTVETIWALILGVARNIVADHTRLTTPETATVWQAGRLPTGLYGRTLGVVGLGRLGSRVAAIAKVFGMNVLAWSENMTAEKAEAAGAKFAGSKEELMRQSDFVSVHVLLSERTVDLIGEAELRLMKKTAFLINTSRGPIVNEAALIKVLKEDAIAGAALDVYNVEPLPVNHELRKLGDKVLMLPHMAYVCDTAYEVFYRETVEDVLAYLSGSPIRVMT
ncbi:D-isomer-specific 2-hydroxyacid dehydrogenase NAD-binding protein [Myxozyma melibiosi]|uniref:D-isomer-specific 2-hydroxyacid dehydrogenase NAD-binding protein n=1 Tax=Myxozyma melibiosi TaxID=54550 RepID=A0ABR1F1V3_9ASCO